MEIDRDYALFEEWNQAVEAELGIRIRGPLLSASGRTHYRILDLGAGQVQAPNWQLSRLGYFKPPLPDYPLGLVNQKPTNKHGFRFRLWVGTA